MSSAQSNGLTRVIATAEVDGVFYTSTATAGVTKVVTRDGSIRTFGVTSARAAERAIRLDTGTKVQVRALMTLDPSIVGYDAAVLVDSPICYVKLDEAPGATQAIDYGFNAAPWDYSTGVNLGLAPLLSGHTSASAGAQGVAKLAAPPAELLTTWNGVSMEAWIDMFDLAQLGWIANINASTSSYGMAVGDNFPGTRGGNFITWTSEGGPVIEALTPGKHHLAFTYTPEGSLSIYLDGSPVHSSTHFPGLPLDGPPSVGGELLSGVWFYMTSADLRISHVAIYAGVLTADRMLAHFTAGVSALLTVSGKTAVTIHAGASLRSNGRTSLSIRAIPAGNLRSDGRTVVAASGTTTSNPHLRSDGRTSVVVTAHLDIRVALVSSGRTSVFANGLGIGRGDSDQRTVGGVVITMPTPAIVGGKPTLPAYWAKLPSTATATEGAKHIHAIKDPNPVWNPYTSGWYTPPAVPTDWAARWSVNDLPDPAGYAAGFYWLGDPTPVDGTANIQAGARQWNPDGSTPHAPAWRSAFPFKPSVTAANHYLQGGGIVHHPKGVNFNSHFIEHMWTNFGNTAQPFTWVIAGMVASWPNPNYVHTVLDSGVNPASRGITLSADDCNTPRRINDGLPNRTLLQVASGQLISAAHPNSPSGTMRARTSTPLVPCLLIAIYNGANSYLGLYRPGSKRLVKGRMNTDASHFYVLGRANGWLDQNRASHLLLFEMRFWTKALTGAQLDAQYAQLSSTYQFNAYRGL